MWEFSTISYPFAREDYNCMAWEWLENDDLEEFTEAEQAIIGNAKNEGFKIIKGTKYIKQQGKLCGEFTTFRARLDLHEICLDNDVYQY